VIADVLFINISHGGDYSLRDGVGAHGQRVSRVLYLSAGFLLASYKQG